MAKINGCSYIMKMFIFIFKTLKMEKEKFGKQKQNTTYVFSF